MGSELRDTVLQAGQDEVDRIPTGRKFTHPETIDRRADSHPIQVMFGDFQKSSVKDPYLRNVCKIA